jgi:hypothetical protein
MPRSAWGCGYYFSVFLGMGSFKRHKKGRLRGL